MAKHPNFSHLEPSDPDDEGTTRGPVERGPVHSTPVRGGPVHSSLEGERLQKVLAQAGLGSRRACEELILEGRVEIDGRPAKELGVRVDPKTQTILVDGEPFKLPKRFVYYALNKPRGVITSHRDQSGRPRVVDLLPMEPRVFPVGRLDMDSEGLILLTNDGELANRLAHPKFGVSKTYQVQVLGHPTPETLAQLEQGMYLAEGFAKAAGVVLKRTHKQSAILEMVLEEGRNRQVRRLFAKVEHRVQRLKRIAIGPLRLGEMAPGEFRKLTPQEVDKLRESIGKKGDGGRRRFKKKAAGSRKRLEELSRESAQNRPFRKKTVKKRSSPKGVAAPRGRSGGRAAAPPKPTSGRNTRMGGKPPKAGQARGKPTKAGQAPKRGSSRPVRGTGNRRRGKGAM